LQRHRCSSFVFDLSQLRPSGERRIIAADRGTLDRELVQRDTAMMEAEGAPRRSVARPDAVVISVTVTVTDAPSGCRRRFREQLPGIRLHRLARAAAAAVVVLATLGITLDAQGSQKTRPAATRRAQPSQRERTAIASALGYPYPLRCLKITISDSNGAYARANVDRTSGCVRYHGYLNASLHRVDGAWRLLLDEGQLFVSNSLLVPVRTATRVSP
jgi:hypothetical protein